MKVFSGQEKSQNQGVDPQKIKLARPGFLLSTMTFPAQKPQNVGQAMGCGLGWSSGQLHLVKCLLQCDGKDIGVLDLTLLLDLHKQTQLEKERTDKQTQPWDCSYGTNQTKWKQIGSLNRNFQEKMAPNGALKGAVYSKLQPNSDFLLDICWYLRGPCLSCPYLLVINSLQ